MCFVPEILFSWIQSAKKAEMEELQTTHNAKNFAH